VVCSLLLAACGGDARGPAKSPEPARDLSELDALEHDLVLSERRLLAELERKQVLVRATSPELGKSSSAPPPAAEPAPSPAQPIAEAEHADLEQDQESPRTASVGTPCDLACRALASMRRAAEGICSLAGEGDQRCSNARARVEQRRAEVANAGCACRGG
jgi:hypothetical protein